MMILQVSPPTGHVVDNMSLHRKFSHNSITSAQVPSCVHLPCWSGASDVLVALILVELGGHGHNLLQCQPRSVNIMLEFDDLSLLPPIPSTHLPCPCCLPRQICGSPRATCLLVELHQRTCHPNLHSMLSTSKLHQVLRKPRFQIPTLTVQDITTKPQPYTPCSSRYFWPAYFVFSNTSDNEDPNHLLPENTVQLWLSQLLPSAHFLPLNCQGSRNAWSTPQTSLVPTARAFPDDWILHGDTSAGNELFDLHLACTRGLTSPLPWFQTQLLMLYDDDDFNAHFNADFNDDGDAANATFANSHVWNTFSKFSGQMPCSILCDDLLSSRFPCSRPDPRPSH